MTLPTSFRQTLALAWCSGHFAPNALPVLDYLICVLLLIPHVNALDRHSRAGGNPVTYVAKSLDSRLRGNDGIGRDLNEYFARKINVS